mmetsp:Transcript_41178/g.98618  ORF Transcript_41178/g.98618 Transcript_41178/m.98618 type:complete len:191 (-) Transcript_41178:1422-1994(-)
MFDDDEVDTNEYRKQRAAELNDPEWVRLRLKLVTVLNQAHVRRFLRSANASEGQTVARCFPLSIWSQAIHKVTIMHPNYQNEDAMFRFYQEESDNKKDDQNGDETDDESEDESDNESDDEMYDVRDDELPPPWPRDETEGDQEESTEEVKMWGASAVYLLLRDGLTGSDGWHERRSSAKLHHGRKRKTCS